MIVDLQTRKVHVSSGYMVIICAYNEAHNLRILLPRLEQASALIVDDGSTDGTSTVADELGFKVLKHGTREGKTKALADGVSYAKSQGIDVVVDIGADAIPDRGTLEKLVHAVKPKDVGGASARQIPVRSGSNVAYKIDELIWAVLACAKDHQMRQERDSYLGAVMFAFKVGTLQVRDVTNDDELVGYHLRSNGLRTVFLNDALVYFDASRSLAHIVERRRRMLFGHIVQPESGAPSRSRRVSLEGLASAIAEKPARAMWALPAVIIEGFARAQAWSDFRHGTTSKYRRWVSVTKTSEVGSRPLAGR